MAKSWNGGKGNKTDKELNKIQKLAHENKKLKNEINRLRKAVTRVESGWCPGCLEKYEGKENSENLPEPCLTVLPEKDRTCFKCSEGKLKIVKYYKLEETYYFRGCDHCGHRTRGKKWTPDVKE